MVVPKSTILTCLSALVIPALWEQITEEKPTIMRTTNTSKNFLTGLIFLISFILYVSCGKDDGETVDSDPEVITYRVQITSTESDVLVEGFSGGKIVATDITDNFFKAELVYNSNAFSSKSSKSGNLTGKSAAAGELDSVSLSKTGFLRTVFKNVQPGTPLVLPIVEDPLAEAANIGIELIRGGPYANGAQVTLTKWGNMPEVYSINSTDEEPTQLAYFENVYAPASYEVKVKSLQSDAEFPEQRDTIFVAQGTTTFKPFNIEDYADQHTIFFRVKNQGTVEWEKLEGATVEMFDATTDELIETKTTPVSGEVIFVVNEGSDIYFTNKYQDNYKVTNGIYKVPDDIQLASDVADTLNVISFPKIYYRGDYFPIGTVIPASIINLYKPVALNPAWLRGELYYYFPPSPSRDVIISEVTNFIGILGVYEGNINVSSTPFPEYAVGDPIYDNYTAKFGWSKLG